MLVLLSVYQPLAKPRPHHRSSSSSGCRSLALTLSFLKLGACTRLIRLFRTTRIDKRSTPSFVRIDGSGLQLDPETMENELKMIQNTYLVLLIIHTSSAGFREQSKMTTRFALVKLIPTPPAFVKTKNNLKRRNTYNLYESR